MLKAALAALLSIAAVVGGTEARADAHYYVAGGDPACSDAGPGSAATPWCSIEKAGSAPAGATVLVRSGSYGELVVRGRTDLTVRAFPAERPVLADVFIDGRSARVTVSGLTIRGNAPDVGEVYVKQSEDILLEHLHLDRAHFRSRGTNRLTIRSSLVENGALYTDATAAGVFCGCGVDARELADEPTSNIVIRGNRFVNMAGDGVHLNSVVGSIVEGNYFHTSHPYGTGDHVDVIQVFKGSDHVIRSNEAYEWRHGILTTDDAPVDGPDADHRAMIVENNLVHTASGYAFNGAPGPNSLIANNTWTGSQDGVAKGAAVRWRVGSNPGTTESPGAIFANNLVDGTCACDDRIAYRANVVERDVAFADGYELPAGSPAINAADPAYAPPTDLRCRGRNGNPDVGALEYEGIRPGTPTPTPCVPECERTCDEQIADPSQRAIDPAPACSVVAPALGNIRRALRADLKTATRALRRLGIDRLLERGRFAIRGFDALTAGTLRVTLTARTATAARRRVLARAKRSFIQPGRYRVRVKLTRKGKRILRRSRTRTATLAVAFSECSGRTVRRSHKLTLRR